MAIFFCKSICICLNKAPSSWTLQMWFHTTKGFFYYFAATVGVEVTCSSTSIPLCSNQMKLTYGNIQKHSSAKQSCSCLQSLRQSSYSKSVPVMCCSPAAHTSVWIKCCDIHSVCTKLTESSSFIYTIIHKSTVLQPFSFFGFWPTSVNHTHMNEHLIK